MVLSIAIAAPSHGSFPYTRLNHFCELISQQNVSEHTDTDIPSHVYARIYQELERLVISKDQLDIATLRDIVNGLYGIRYRDCIPSMFYVITDRKPLAFSREITAKLKARFQAILEPFDLYKPASCTNFLSYYYVVHQLCLLLDLTEHANCFPLMKSATSRRRHDEIWKPICTHLSWQFNPTV